MIYIDSIAIAPEYQEKGYGTMMIKEFIKTFSKDRCVTLNKKKGIPAYSLYKKLGFHETKYVTMQKSPLIDKLNSKIEKQKAQLKQLIKEKEKMFQEINKLEDTKM